MNELKRTVPRSGSRFRSRTKENRRDSDTFFQLKRIRPVVRNRDALRTHMLKFFALVIVTIFITISFSTLIGLGSSQSTQYLDFARIATGENIALATKTPSHLYPSIEEKGGGGFDQNYADVYLDTEEIRRRMKRTAVVWATTTIADECEASRLRHIVDTAGVDVWVMHTNFNISQEAINRTMSYISSIPGLKNFLQQEENFFPFDEGAGSSKSSFLRWFHTHHEKYGYDFAWLVESDVFYSGPWREVIRDESFDNWTDFLSFRTLHHGLEYWFQLDQRECTIDQIPCRELEAIQTGWMLARISSRLASSLYFDVQNGNVKAHHEAAPAPYCRKRGFSIGEPDMSKVGHHFVSGHINTEQNRKQGIQDLNSIQPEVATLSHPLKCLAYQDDEQKIHDDMKQYALRDLMSPKEIRDQRKVNTAHAYWINSDENIGQRRYMEMNFQNLGPWRPHTRRIKALTSRQISDLLVEGTLLWNRSENFFSSSSDQNESQKATIAKLLSHFKAILTAYKSGQDQVLILEDDVRLSKRFFSEWQKLVGMAPQDWSILQWSTSCKSSLRQNFQIRDPWITWFPDHLGTHAYTINRNGMESILQHVHKVDSQGRDVWMIFNDVPFFSFAKHAYTSTAARIHSNSTLDALNTTVPAAFHFGEKKLRKSILVLMTLRIEWNTDIEEQFGLIKSDTEALCRHYLLRCDWVIQPIFAGASILENVINSVESYLPSNIRILPPKKDSKSIHDFVVVHEMMNSSIGDYHDVLLKDSNQRLTGFPWTTFVESKGEAIIAGPLRESVVKTAYHDDIEEQVSFPLHWANSWKNSASPTWSIEMFEKLQTVEVAFLGSYFTLLDGNFADWFFKKYLESNFSGPPKLLPEKSSLVNLSPPDFLWCSAARMFKVKFSLRKRTPCTFVPVVSAYDEDASVKKIENFGRVPASLKWDQIQHIKSHDPQAGRWLQWSHSFVQLSQLPDHFMIEANCRRLFGTPIEQPFLLSDCTRRINGRNILFERSISTKIQFDPALHLRWNVPSSLEFHSLPNFQFCRWSNSISASYPTEWKLQTIAATEKGVEHLSVGNHTDDQSRSFPGHAPMVLQLDLDCTDILRTSAHGTGNWVQMIFMLRLAAAANASPIAQPDAKRTVDLLFSCSERKIDGTEQVLPWLMGFFNATKEAEALSIEWSADQLLDIDCPERAWGNIPVSLMVSHLRKDLRRMAVALVGAPSDDPNHPAHEFGKNIRADPEGALYQLGYPSKSLFSNIDLDETAVHFRCGDIMASSHAQFRFLSFEAYARRIDPSTRSIGIITQPFRDSNSTQSRRVDQADVFRASVCKEVVLAFRKYLQDRFPQSRVSIRNGKGETVALAYARLIMATKGSFAAPDSSFSVFPVLASFGQGYHIYPTKLKDSHTLVNQWLLASGRLNNDKQVIFMNETNILHAPETLEMKAAHIVSWFKRGKR